jgi:hypothetical protein
MQTPSGTGAYEGMKKRPGSWSFVPKLQSTTRSGVLFVNELPLIVLDPDFDAKPVHGGEG